MEDLIKKVSYLKGYADGLDLSPKSDEGKLIIKLLDVMSEMADTIEELNSRVDDVEDVVDELDDCVLEIADDLYGDDEYDDYDDDEFYDDDDFADDGDFEEKPRRSFFGKKNNKEESFNDFDADEDKTFQPSASSKVTPMRSAAKHGGNMEVCVVKPTSVDDSREITETLLAGRTVILNLEGMDLEIAQRIIDFISGAAFAISGNLQKISSYIFLVTPTNVDISGDLQDLLSGSMETPSVRGRY